MKLEIRHYTARQVRDRRVQPFRLEKSVRQDLHSDRVCERWLGAVIKHGNLFLQGWALVENTSDDDWNNVRMVLVSGRPISYQMNLYEPLYIPRPTVEPELFASLRPPVYGGAMTTQGPGMAGAPAAPAQPAQGHVVGREDLCGLDQAVPGRQHELRICVGSTRPCRADSTNQR